MTNTELIKEILSDLVIREKYDISEADLNNIDGDTRYQKEVVLLVKEIVTDNANHLSSTISYNKIKNILNI
jgi:hypothetical protein